MTNHDSLDSVLKPIAERHAAEIAQAVRGYLNELLSTGAAKAPVVAAPKRRGRPPKAAGSQPKVAVAHSAPVAPAKAAKPAKAPKAAKPPKAGKAPRKKIGKRRLISHAEQKAVLDLLAKKPGLTSLQIQKEAGIDAKQAARVLNKLRGTKKVKWKGERASAAYTVA